MSQEPDAYIDDSRELRDDDTFCFSCGPEKSCFTSCCYDINLVLMPYDILRLKNRLGMSSDDFLKRYTSVHVGPGTGLPVVLLKMEGPYMKCPFLDEKKGCGVYEDRPAACRTYPLARIAHRSRDMDGVEEFYYVVREPDCMGFKDGREMTVRQWKEQEGLGRYNEMNDIFGELLQAKTESGIAQLHADQIETFYLGCYNVDEFRKFYLESPNLDRYMDPEDVVQRISEDEEELLIHGMRWVKKKIFSGCTMCAMAQK